MSPGKILVVEDEALVVLDVRNSLQRLGYSVPAVAQTGAEALALARLHNPDLILMDVQLSGEMDGIETVRQILLEQRVPVIYLTAHSDAPTLERAKLTSPYGFLLKPIENTQLGISVEMALYLFRVETQAHLQQARYQTILQTALDGMLVMDLHGKIQHANEAYCLLIGYTAEELNRLTWKELETDPQWREVEQCIRAGAARFESRQRMKNGELVEVEVSIKCLPEQNLLFAFLRNITERKRTQQEVLLLNVHLKQQAQANEILYHTERMQREMAESLMEASNVIASTLEIDVVLDRIMDQVSQIVKNDVCNVVLLNGEQATVVRSRGYEQFDARTFVETFVFPLEQSSIRRYIVETHEPVVVPDVRVDQRWALAEEKIWLRSYVAAPIIIRGEVVGLLNVGISIPDFYHDVHGRVLTAFANHAAVAFQNARLFEDVQNSARRLESLSRRLLSIQETERRYIARELHDEIGQTLTAARINVQAIERLKKFDEVREKVKESLEILNLALSQVRNMSVDLHPSVLDDLGLVPALRWHADREARWGNFVIRVQAEEFGFRLEYQLELACFRIVQEALTNAMRHANASEVVVSLRREGGQVLLSIEDNGQGFNVAEAVARAEQGGSLGLLGMRERATLAGGQLEIHSSGRGTRICAILPLREELALRERTL